MGQWLASVDCVECLELHEGYRNEGFEIYAPCDTCFPGIHPYNKAAFEVYRHCSNQMLLGMGGPVSINMFAVESVIDKLNYAGVTDIPKEDILDVNSDIQILFSSRLEVHRRNSKAEAEAKAKVNKK